jgi:hydrogenase maturation protease
MTPDAGTTGDRTDVTDRPWVVLGLGNAILCDDGVGIKVVRFLAQNNARADVVYKEAELAGFALIDLLEGFERAIVVDAVRLRDATAPGEVTVFEASRLEPSMHLVAGHQIDLPTALEMGRRLGRPVPDLVRVVGVQIENDTTFSESCTPAVEAAIPAAADAVLRIIEGGV